MVNITRQQILEAVTTALEALKESDGVKTVAAYNGEVDEASNKQINIIAPALLISYKGGRIEGDPSRNDEERQAGFTVIVISKNLTSASKRNEGVNRLMDAVENALHRKDLGLLLSGYIEFEQDGLVATAPGMLAYAMTFTINFRKGYEG